MLEKFCNRGVHNRRFIAYPEHCLSGTIRFPNRNQSDRPTPLGETGIATEEMNSRKATEEMNSRKATEEMESPTPLGETRIVE